MNNLLPFPNRRKAREDASLWIARLDRGLSTAERVELEQWVAAKAIHRNTLAELAERWDELDVLSELAELFPLQASPRERKSRPYGWAYAASAAVLAVAAIGWLVATSVNQTLQPAPIEAVAQAAQIYETAIGEQSSVRLSDGSAVTLNTDTLIEVQYSAAERTVLLRRGEGHFIVADDVDRPFNVYAGSRVVQAVGTAFNVQLGPSDAVEVTVTDGTVVLGQLRDSTSGIVQTRFEPQPTTVSAGEIAILNEQISTVEKLDPEDIDIQLAWQRGMIVFQGEPLEVILAEVSRYTTVKFSMADDEMRNIRVAGYFPAGDVERLLLALHENFQIESQRFGSDQILLTAQ